MSKQFLFLSCKFVISGLASRKAHRGLGAQSGPLFPYHQSIFNRSDLGERRGANCTLFYFLSPHHKSGIVLFDSYHNPRGMDSIIPISQMSPSRFQAVKWRVTP